LTGATDRLDTRGPIRAGFLTTAMPRPLENLKTSGDPLADRRYGYGAMLRGAGDLAAAADLFAQTIDLAPRWVAAWVVLAETRLELGDAPGALEAWRAALALDPSDPFGIELKLALNGLLPAPQTPPEGYVRALFDDYAPGFEAALVGQLGYCAPLAIGAAVNAARPGARFARVLDLGCGTGLTGEVLRGRAAWLEGVDLSPGMVDQARAKRVFDALHTDEALRFLAGPESVPRRRFDLIAAGDMAPYLGDLTALFGLVARVLEPGGLLVLSVELALEGDGRGWALQPSMRYSHSAAYLTGCAEAAGLAVLAIDPLTLRLDRGEPVAGAVASFATQDPIGADLGEIPAPSPDTRAVA
jgi:predicted TPR repeat methyltransferase